KTVSRPGAARCAPRRARTCCRASCLRASTSRRRALVPSAGSSGTRSRCRRCTATTSRSRSCARRGSGCSRTPRTTRSAAARPTKELRCQDPILWEQKLLGAAVPEAVARRLHGREFFGRYVNGYRIEDGRAVLDVGDDPDPEWHDVDRMMEDLTVETADGTWDLRVVAQPKRTVAAAVP